MATTLQDKVEAAGDIVAMLRNAPTGPYVFPVPAEHSNWRDEQRAWAETAVLFDQSYHMTDVSFRGPGLKRLLMENSINNYEHLAPLKAFQFTTLASSGMIIGDGIGLAHQDGSASIVGKPTPANYLAFVAEAEGHDVEVIRDARTLEGNLARRFYRFQLHGPAAFDIFDSAAGEPVARPRPFGLTEFTVAGHRVTALRHGMAGGEGLEFWGPFGERDPVLETVLRAGERFGLRRGGARAYGSAAPWSGWLGSILPAIYTGGDMLPFRKHLPAQGFEGTLSLGGSFDAPLIDDWYMDPWDVGYHRFIHWDHEFRGRDALTARRGGPHRRKLWLHWHPGDMARIFADQSGPPPRPKFLEWPSGQYANTTFDKVLLDGRPAGISANPTYTVHSNGWFSLGILDPQAAVPGTEVVLIWGEPGGGSRKPTVEAHRQVEVRATVAEGPVRRI